LGPEHRSRFRSAKIKIRVLNNKIGEEPIAKEALQCLTRTARQVGSLGRADDPGRPIDHGSICMALIKEGCPIQVLKAK
jgi:hypothetical protein